MAHTLLVWGKEFENVSSKRRREGTIPAWEKKNRAGKVHRTLILNFSFNSLSVYLLALLHVWAKIPVEKVVLKMPIKTKTGDIPFVPCGLQKEYL